MVSVFVLCPALARRCPYGGDVHRAPMGDAVSTQAEQMPPGPWAKPEPGQDARSTQPAPPAGQLLPWGIH